MKTFEKLIAEYETKRALDPDATVHFMVNSKGPYTGAIVAAIRRRRYIVKRANGGGFLITGKFTDPSKG